MFSPKAVGALVRAKQRHVECYRLYPPGALFARKTCEEISICGYTIPKRATVVVSPFLVHRDEDVFPDPEKFDPDRFLPENIPHIPDCAYIPFAAGPRNCIGHTFAEIEVKVLVCHILRKISPSLSGLDGPSASHRQNHSPVVSTRPHQVSTQTTVNDFSIVHSRSKLIDFLIQLFVVSLPINFVVVL
ncbi:cytochrome P450 4c3 [Caerostris darwini]|uniref:Cytochrome P450 4c3 n=1 Tax=Caerostris darwini TaxID=1538125 RepID=A0AAV4WNK4_9ARAC|nr:cytochrome P450 4c3 [Caerostris darwini]